jgi:hypothetical protein
VQHVDWGGWRVFGDFLCRAKNHGKVLQTVVCCTSHCNCFAIEIQTLCDCFAIAIAIALLSLSLSLCFRFAFFRHSPFYRCTVTPQSLSSCFGVALELLRNLLAVASESVSNRFAVALQIAFRCAIAAQLLYSCIAIDLQSFCYRSAALQSVSNRLTNKRRCFKTYLTIL